MDWGVIYTIICRTKTTEEFRGSENYLDISDTIKQPTCGDKGENGETTYKTFLKKIALSTSGHSRTEK